MLRLIVIGSACVLTIMMSPDTGLLSPTGADAAGSPPQVVSVTPASGASNVATNTPISVTFNEAMNASSLNGALTLRQLYFFGVAGSVSYNASNFTATFVPSAALATNRTYTVALSSSATDTNGNAVSSRTWNFTTARSTSTPSNPAPQVTSTSPAAGATNVATNAQVKAVFSEAINASTINTSSFTLSGPSGAIAGIVSYDAPSLTATFAPSGALANGASFTATITTAVHDSGGAALAANKTWSFSTVGAVSTPPPAGPPPATSLTPSGPMVVSGRNSVTIENMKITSTTGACLTITSSTNVIIRNSEIGPCAGNAIAVAGSTTVNIVDNYIHSERAGNGCNPCDRGDGVFATRSNSMLIQGNVIAFGESNVELLGVKDTQVIGNFLLNPLGPAPRGSQVQVWAYENTRSSNIRVDSNYAVSSRDPKYAIPEGQTEAANFGYTDGAVVTGNYITGGQFVSGCGILADVSANSMQFRNNTVIETGECGIGIASGTNQVVDGNRIYTHGLNSPNAGNTALYVWKQGSSACGPVQVSNNVAVLIRPNGSLSSYWKGAGCDTTSVSGNTWDQGAINMMTPLDSMSPAPASIPPQPYQTKVASPFTK